MDDSNFVFENAPAQVLFSSPVGAVSTRPVLPLAVSWTPSANFPVWFPDREDSSLSGFSLVLSGSDLLSERVALPLDDFGSSSSVVPALCDSDSLCAVSQLQAPWLINHRWLPSLLRSSALSLEVLVFLLQAVNDASGSVSAGESANEQIVERDIDNGEHLKPSSPSSDTTGEQFPPQHSLSLLRSRPREQSSILSPGKVTGKASKNGRRAIPESAADLDALLDWGKTGRNRLSLRGSVSGLSLFATRSPAPRLSLAVENWEEFPRLLSLCDRLGECYRRW